MEEIMTALTTQLGTIGTSLTGVLTSTLPIALPIIGGVFCVKKGIGIFKTITSKT